jgi:GNAT superfamily N-acetyltransferase
VWIHELADWLGKRTVETFNEQFGHDLPAMEDRCLFLVAPDGRTVGTTTAWYENDFCGRSWGRIHWVAIIPEFQGRGLAKPMMTAAMNRLTSSHDNAYLFTHTLRVPAVNLYLNFGFRPLVRSDAERAGWQDLRGQLKPHPLMQEPWLTPETLYDGTD